METNEKVAGTEETVVVAEKQPSKLSRMVEMLHVGATKSQIVDMTGLKLSTVNCQLYCHLPNKGWVIKKEVNVFKIESKGEPRLRVKKEQEVVLLEA